jgi:hypothetical protein
MVLKNGRKYRNHKLFSYSVKYFFAIPLLIILSTSCKKETSCESCIAANKHPIANAGANQAIILPTDSVLLDGSASLDPDGTINEWKWTKLSGPPSSPFYDSRQSKPIVKKLQAGIYHFELMVKDNGGLSSIDTVQITVISRLVTNRPPVANAGADLTISPPANSEILDGTSSIDPDNNIAGYLWRQISGPSSSNIVNTNVALTQVNNLHPGDYLFELKVTDTDGLFSTDSIWVKVKGSGNVAFFFIDPTGGLDVDSIQVIEKFSPRIVLVRVKIANFPDAEIEGVWSKKLSPWCPTSAMWVEPTALGYFNLPPGTYTWTAESETIDLNSFPVPISFKTYWGAGPHAAKGTITVPAGSTCILKEIIF